MKLCSGRAKSGHLATRGAALTMLLVTALGPSMALGQPAQPNAAQPRNAPAPPPAAAGPVQPNGMAAPATPATPAGAPAPGTADDVNDPMLLPVPAAPQDLSGWQQALQLIATRDSDLQTAVIEVTRLKGVRREALASALPTITGTGTATLNILHGSVQAEVPGATPGSFTVVNERVPTHPGSVTGSLQLVQPILAPRTWYAIGTADANTDLAKLSIEDKKRTLVAAAADAIVAVVSAEHVAEINRVSLRATLRRLALQERNVALGGGKKLDTVRFAQDVSAARATLIDGDEALLEAREKLGLTLGSAVPYGVPPNISLDAIQQAAEQTCRRGELKDRADLRVLRAQKAITQRSVHDADLMYSPTAELLSTAAISSDPILGTTGHGTWNVQAVLSVPIWDGGFRYGARRAAKASVDEEEMKVASGVRSATVQVAQANRQIDVAGRALEVARTARDLAAETLRLAQISFDSGAGTSFDIVDASRTLRSAELTLADKELNLVQAKVESLVATAVCDY